MALARDILLQMIQLALVVALAPALTGLVRRIKARLTGRVGPSIIQPYRDLARLLRKEAIVAESASWLFRAAPYLVFGTIWIAAGLVPTFSTDLLLHPAADMIALVALLGTARFFLALAGLDVGTSFGGIGASREMMIATFAEPAMLMVVFTIALVAGTTSLSSIAFNFLTHEFELRVSLGFALLAMLVIAIAENARIPVDNPATHLELTMVHEAMVLEYSGRHLALIELAAATKLLLYVSLIGCVFVPWGITTPDSGAGVLAAGLAFYVAKLAVAGGILAAFETSIAKMRLFRVTEFLGGALLIALIGTVLFFIARSA